MVSLEVGLEYPHTRIRRSETASRHTLIPQTHCLLQLLTFTHTYSDSGFPKQPMSVARFGHKEDSRRAYANTESRQSPLKQTMMPRSAASKLSKGCDSRSSGILRLSGVVGARGRTARIRTSGIRTVGSGGVRGARACLI